MFTNCSTSIIFADSISYCSPFSLFPFCISRHFSGAVDTGCHVTMGLFESKMYKKYWEFQVATMASLCHILMGRNGDYFLNYIDYSKNFDAVLKLLLVI